MSDDIVERLRLERRAGCPCPICALLDDAIAEIERLRSDRTSLWDVLRRMYRDVVLG